MPMECRARRSSATSTSSTPGSDARRSGAPAVAVGWREIRSERFRRAGWGRSLVEAVRAVPEARYGLGDGLLEVAIEELSLGDVDRCLDVLSFPPPCDPRGHAISDRFGSDPDVQLRVVVLGHVERDGEDRTRVFDEPPAALPAGVAVEVMGEARCVVGDDALAGPRCSSKQPANILVEVAGDPIDERRSPVIDVGIRALVPRQL